MSGFSASVAVAVEGDADEAVLARLAADAGVFVSAVHVKHGKPNLRNRIHGFNSAARHRPFIVLIDLDQEAPCAPEISVQWLPEPAEHMYFQVAVRCVEAWLLADIEGLSSFLRVSRSVFPTEPEQETNAKVTLVNLARRSRSRQILEDMVPRAESGRVVGPAYTGRIIEFARSLEGGWSPARAAARSASLRRCIRKLEEIRSKY